MHAKTLRYLVISSLVVLGALAFYIGLQLANRIDSRGPAAIPRNYDFSNLVGEELKIAATERLLGGAKIITAGTLSGVQLGHFQLKDSQRNLVGACDIYGRVEMVFQAGDMAVNGEAPEMIVTGPCETTDSGDEILPLMFDYKLVRRLAVKDRELQSENNSLLSVRFRNVSDSWPKIWVLSSLRLEESARAHHGSKNEIQIAGPDIKRILSKNLIIEWPGE